MVNIIKQPPTDSFTFELFDRLVRHVSIPNDSIYFWAHILDGYTEIESSDDGEFIKDRTYYWKEILNHITKDLIILGIKDNLGSFDFNPWIDDKPYLIEKLHRLFVDHAHRKFVLFTSHENLESYLTNTNLIIIPWGGDIVNQRLAYESLDPVIDKDMSSKQTFISLNRNTREHRAVLVCLLFGMSLQEYGVISAMFRSDIDIMIDNMTWPGTESNNILGETIRYGCNLLKTANLLINDDRTIYSNSSTNDNVSNFNNSLREHYRQVFVDIISETSYLETSFNFTEKTQHSIYGYCFPILICSSGAVNTLRQMGMDVFDDIVDHRYDLISDPMTRMYTAINSNLRLLTDSDYTKQLWLDNQYRFAKNVQFARTTMFEFYQTRAETLWENAKKHYYNASRSIPVLSATDLICGEIASII